MINQARIHHLLSLTGLASKNHSNQETETLIRDFEIIQKLLDKLQETKQKYQSTPNKTMTITPTAAKRKPLTNRSLYQHPLSIKSFLQPE